MRTGTAFTEETGSFSATSNCADTSAVPSSSIHPLSQLKIYLKKSIYHPAQVQTLISYLQVIRIVSSVMFIFAQNPYDICG